MATISRQLLSGSTNGRNIKVVATATPGTTIHTAVAGTAGFDEVYCWVTNTSASAVGLTVEFGGTTSPDDHLVDVYSIPANSLPIPIITGQNLQNSLVVKMFAATANVLVVSGYVNRIL
jgi:glyoxylate carboligase